MKRIHVFLRKSRSAKKYLSQDGFYLLFCRLLRHVTYGIRDWILSKKAKCPPLHLGESPKLIGLSNISFGHSFRSGKDLWLEAVIRFQGITYSPQIVIGDNVGVSDNVHIGATNRVTIGCGVLIGSRVIIIDHNHGIYSGDHQSVPGIPPNLRRLDADRCVFIGNNVWIGDGVAVLPGATIGDGSIIGANSVVTGTIPANCIAMGSPARPVRHFDEASGIWKRVEAPK